MSAIPSSRAACPHAIRFRRLELLGAQIGLQHAIFKYFPWRVAATPMETSSPATAKARAAWAPWLTFGFYIIELLSNIRKHIWNGASDVFAARR